MASLSWWLKEESRISNILSRSNLTPAQREANERELAVIRLNLQQFSEEAAAPADTNSNSVQRSEITYSSGSGLTNQQKIQKAFTGSVTPDPLINIKTSQPRTTQTTTTDKPKINVAEQEEDETFLKRTKMTVEEFGDVVRSVFGISGDVVGGLGEAPREAALTASDVSQILSQALENVSGDLGQIPPNLTLPTITTVPAATGAAAEDLLESFTSGLEVGLSQIGSGLGSGLKETGEGLGSGLNQVIIPAALIIGGAIVLKEAF